MGSHRVGHNWSDLAAAAVAAWLSEQGDETGRRQDGGIDLSAPLKPAQEQGNLGDQTEKPREWVSLLLTHLHSFSKVDVSGEGTPVCILWNQVGIYHLWGRSVHMQEISTSKDRLQNPVPRERSWAKSGMVPGHQPTGRDSSTLWAQWRGT